MIDVLKEHRMMITNTCVKALRHWIPDKTILARHKFITSNEVGIAVREHSPFYGGSLIEC